MTTKMARTEPEQKVNNIIRDDQDAIDFKRWYSKTLRDNGINQETEGHAIWKSQSQVAKYVSDMSGVHLSVYEVPKSLIVNDIMGWLASQVGGHFTPRVGDLNGSTRDELALVLKQASIITGCEEDAVKCKAAWKQIAKCAERALEELS
jgi:hypothetical protein